MPLRPSLFTDTKIVAAAFASAVTSPSSNHDWVARNGGDSIFALLKIILPEVQEKSRIPS